nr:reverse transcriptase domain-containing protein [Tanacetum cinerariifolium]
MSTRSSARNLFPPLDNLELTIRRRTHVDPNLLNAFNMATEGNGDNVPPVGGGDLPVLDLRTMEDLYQPTLNGRLSIDRCPNHNMLPVTQIDTFYNGLTLRHRDTINATADGTFMKRRPKECYDLIKNMTAHHNDWDTSAQRSESSSSITSSSSDSEIIALKAEMVEINKNLMKVLQINQQVKAVTHNCETCGGPHSYNDCPAIIGQTQNGNNQGRNQFFQGASHGQNPPPAYQAPGYQAPVQDPRFLLPLLLPKVVECETEVTKDAVPLTNNGSNKDVQPSVVQVETQIPNYEPVVAPVVEPVEAPVGYDQMEKFFQIFQESVLILMPKFGPAIKSLLTNKEKLFKLARTPLNEHCSAVLLKNLPEKLGDHSKFLIPCDFSRMDERLALADLGASINLMPLSVWNKLSLPEISPNCMTLELADRSISQELTLPVGSKAVTFNLDQTSRYSTNYDAESINRIDVIDVACEEYSQEVLGFFMSGNPTPSTKPIVSISSPTLAPFGDSDFLLEETDAFLAIEDELISLEIDDSFYDLEGEILFIEEFLNNDPSSPPLTPQELKVVEPKNKKSSIDEPPVVKLKDLPPHLEYAFLEGDDKLPIIIAKYLKDEEKTTLIKVLKSHKQALAWQLSDIKGGFTVVENEENELIPTRLVTGWRVCIDYQKLNDATHKDHFPLSFMDQMLERLAGNEYYCFLDGLSIYFQIPIDPQDQGKTTFTCPYETFAYRRMPFGLCNAPGMFQRCMMAIFHDMIEKPIEVFMDDFSVFGNSFETCLYHLDKMLKRCEDTNICLN